MTGPQCFHSIVDSFNGVDCSCTLIAFSGFCMFSLVVRLILINDRSYWLPIVV